MGRQTSQGPLGLQNDGRQTNRYISLCTYLWDGSYNPYGNRYAYAPDEYARTVKYRVHNQGIRHGRSIARNSSPTDSILPPPGGKSIQQAHKAPSILAKKLGLKESLRKYSRSSGEKISGQLGRTIYYNTSR